MHGQVFEDGVHFGSLLIREIADEVVRPHGRPYDRDE